MSIVGLARADLSMIPESVHVREDDVPAVGAGKENPVRSQKCVRQMNPNPVLGIAETTVGDDSKMVRRIARRSTSSGISLHRESWLCGSHTFWLITVLA